LSEVSGSWKIMAIFRPRIFAYSFSVLPSSSSPRKRTEPEIFAVLGSSPSTAMDVTDLPEPDSPTMPSESPPRNW
jgi:hypothetical protein